MGRHLVAAAAIAIIGGLTACGSGNQQPKQVSLSINPATVDCHDTNLSQEQYDAACGPSNLATESTGEESPNPKASVQTEGSVATKDGSFVKYPDGAVFRVHKLQKVSSDRCYDIKRIDTCVLAQLSMENTGSKTIVFGDSEGVNYALYYGANRYESQSATYMGDSGARELPKQLVPHSSLIAGSTYAVPTDQLGRLTITLSYSTSAHNYTDYTFIDAQTLLK